MAYGWELFYLHSGEGWQGLRIRHSSILLIPYDLAKSNTAKPSSLKLKCNYEKKKKNLKTVKNFFWGETNHNLITQIKLRKFFKTQKISCKVINAEIVTKMMGSQFNNKTKGLELKIKRDRNGS